MSWSRRTTTWKHNAISIRIFSSETTGPIFTEILHDVVALVALFNLAHTWRYPIPFLNDRAISAGVGNFAPFLSLNWLPWLRLPWGIKKRRSDWSSAIQYLPHGAKIVKIGPSDAEILRLRANESGTIHNWLPWQRPLRYWKKNFRSVIYTQNAFIRYKNCKNRTWFVFCLWHKIGCHGNVPSGIGKSGPDQENSRKYLPFGEKIVKISPVDTEIALLRVKKTRNYGR